MPRILVVDDEDKIRSLIRKYAEFEGYEVEEAKDGMEAVTLCREKPDYYDLIILDIMMPELDGFSAATSIRKVSDTPIIMLSARGEEYDRIHGFESGADDYVPKPFSPKELLLRASAILKRSAVKEKKSNVLKFGGVEVDPAARVVTVDGERATLSPKEYDLLIYMVENANIALSREQLLTNVWGYDFFGDDRTLDTHIKLLRKSLGNYSTYIVTVRGVGYRFEADKT